jgi:hypothetical protein
VRHHYDSCGRGETTGSANGSIAIGALAAGGNLLRVLRAAEATATRLSAKRPPSIATIEALAGKGLAEFDHGAVTPGTLLAARHRIVGLLGRADLLPFRATATRGMTAAVP